MKVHEYIAGLPADALLALQTCCDDYYEFHEQNLARSDEENLPWWNIDIKRYHFFIQIMGQLLRSAEREFDFRTGDITDPQEIDKYIRRLQFELAGWLAADAIEQRFNPRLSKLIISDELGNKIQAKTNELRTEVQKASYLKEYHKRRLLLRLEKFQTELHKSISDLDVFLAGVGDVADVMEDVGTKAKPLVDRMREIVGLARDALPKRVGKSEDPKQIEDLREGANGEE